jgi:hypothetical protein
MTSDHELTIEELRLIKAMLLLWPALNHQEILAYFTIPGRRLKDARIKEICDEVYFSNLTPATQEELLAFLAAWINSPHSNPDQFVISSSTLDRANTMKTRRQIEPPRVYRRVFGSIVRLLFYHRSGLYRRFPLLRSA